MIGAFRVLNRHWQVFARTWLHNLMFNVAEPLLYLSALGFGNPVCCVLDLRPCVGRRHAKSSPFEALKVGRVVACVGDLFAFDAPFLRQAFQI